MFMDLGNIPHIVKTLSENNVLPYTIAENIVKTITEGRKQFESYVDSLYLNDLRASILTICKEPTDTNIYAALEKVERYFDATSINLYGNDGERLENLARQHNLDFLKGKRETGVHKGQDVYTIYLPQSEDAQKLLSEITYFIKANGEKPDNQ